MLHMKHKMAILIFQLLACDGTGILNPFMSVLQVQFLKKAVDILCQCRQTLMYTYVFAYYLRKNNQSVIFEVSFLCSGFLYIVYVA